jgi:hypothetical protein
MPGLAPALLRGRVPLSPDPQFESIPCTKAARTSWLLPDVSLQNNFTAGAKLCQNAGQSKGELLISWILWYGLVIMMGKDIQPPVIGDGIQAKKGPDDWPEGTPFSATAK